MLLDTLRRLQKSFIHIISSVFAKLIPAQASARLSWYYCQSQTDPTRPEKYVAALIQSRLERQSCQSHLLDPKKCFIHIFSPKHCQAQP